MAALDKYYVNYYHEIDQEYGYVDSIPDAKVYELRYLHICSLNEYIGMIADINIIHSLKGRYMPVAPRWLKKYSREIPLPGGQCP